MFSNRENTTGKTKGKRQLSRSADDGKATGNGAVQPAGDLTIHDGKATGNGAV